MTTKRDPDSQVDSQTDRAGQASRDLQGEQPETDQTQAHHAPSGEVVAGTPEEERGPADAGM